MRDCIILGSGRSGTSMVAGTLAAAGYSMGAGLHLPRVSNPKGFFEAPAINGLNEELLAPVLRAEPRLGGGQRWLGIPADGAVVRADDGQLARMRAAVAERPFCFKDPRFCFTLPAWRPVLGDVAHLCVFRHPARTAVSIVEECGRAPYLRGVAVDLDHAFRLWTAMYRSVLERLSGAGDWLFQHYDQCLETEGRARLAAFLDAAVDDGFPDPRLRRALPDVSVPAEALELYERLCERAGHAPAEEAPARREAGRDEEPDVSVVTLIGAGEEEGLAEIVADVGAQRGVRTELVVVDTTGGAALSPERARELAVEGARVVRCHLPSRGLAWKLGLEAARAPLVALQLPGCRALPARLAHAVDALREAPEAQIATCDHVLHDEHGQFVDRVHPDGMGGEPGPFWESGAVLRREALAAIRETAFHPVELRLYRELREAGQAVHVAEPGFSVARERYAAGWERSRHDAALVALAGRPFTGQRPELSVSLCTYQRKDVLVECLEGFCRQLLPPGTFEVVLVDDGSTDGTADLVDALELPVPVRIVHRANGGLAAARNSGLAIARGRLVLFVNDDTIPAPDLVEQHVETHARVGPGRRVAVLGTFAQPPAALDNALMRHLEESTEVFDFAALRPGELYDGFHFYTCNVSVPLDAVRAVGGFDPSFRHYGCEDADLGLRLEALGYRVVYAPAARALHRHLLSFDDLARRQRTVARAYVRLARKHPEILARWGNERLTAAWCQKELAQVSDAVAAQEAAARELARIDVGALERLDGAYRELAVEVRERLGGMISELNPHWWREGYVEGLHEHGLAGFDELVAAGAEPRPISAACERRLLAWPRWSDPASLDRLMDLARPLAGRGFAALVLRHDAALDPPREEALAALEEAYTRRLADAPELEVVLEEAPLDRPELLQLGRSVDALLATGDEREDFLAAVAVERLSTPDEVAAWRERFAQEDAPARNPSPAVEVSVIAPTHDRPAELVQLLEALDRQTLPRSSFEVIVVDDASGRPATEVLAGRSYGFALTVLRQEGGGPGVARNRALARARGDVVVFFNDDAVPAPDNLRRHRDAHRWSSGPRVVQGPFTLLPDLRRDSFAELVETTAVLFAQPRMKPGVHYRGLSLCTGNVSIPRAALEAVGGFDETLPYAGGEDTELGLRLERELGLRVVYDPSVRCHHDHRLDVGQLARRKRVLGWAAVRIEAAHGPVGLVREVDEPVGPVREVDEPDRPVGEGDEPRDEAFWADVRREAEGAGAEIERLVAEVDAVCSLERERGTGPRVTDRILPAVERIAWLEFRRGLLCAHDGRRPEELGAAAPVPVGAGASAEGDPRTRPGGR